MRSFLNELIQQVEVLSMTEILTQILVAAALGFVIYLSYYMSICHIQVQYTVGSLIQVSLYLLF